MSRRVAPLAFALTDDEARIAASRAMLRLALSGGLIGRHIAPLAAFVLAVGFAGVLGFTDLLSRRAAEIVILLAAAAFMVQRLITHRRFLASRRRASAWAERLKQAGGLTLSFDEDSATLSGSGLDRQWRLSEIEEVEDAGGMIYCWPRAGEPLFWPTRAYPDAAAAADFLAFARAQGASARVHAAAVDDDD